MGYLEKHDKQVYLRHAKEMLELYETIAVRNLKKDIPDEMYLEAIRQCTKWSMEVEKTKTELLIN